MTWSRASPSFARGRGAPPAATERYDPSYHDTSEFESGTEALDRWLVRPAGQSEQRDAARTFVLTDGAAVIGYYALLAGELDHGQATAQTRKGMSRHYPIPVAILARLAVDRSHHQQGLGASNCQMLWIRQ
jgi:predicted N-acetyltransferase YhbS